MSIKIVTDSTCDLPQDIIEELNISVIPLYINIGNQGFLDGVELTRKEFYENLPYYSPHPTTSAPSTFTIKQIYRNLIEQGASQILSIHISESLSGTLNIAKNAAEEFNQEIGSEKVIVRDGGQLSLGTGFQVELAAKMAKQGHLISEIIKSLEDLGNRTLVAASIDSLTYLRRSGRMNMILTGIGSLLKLKPILEMNNGKPQSAKVRTTSRATEYLIEKLRKQMPIEKFALLHTNAAEKAEEFKNKILDLIPTSNVLSVDITPVLGTHLGPGAVGFVIVSKNPINY